MAGFRSRNGGVVGAGNINWKDVRILMIFLSHDIEVTMGVIETEDKQSKDWATGHSLI